MMLIKILDLQAHFAIMPAPVKLSVKRLHIPLLHRTASGGL